MEADSTDYSNTGTLELSTLALASDRVDAQLVSQVPP
jgi:hypothetical protein